MKWYHGTYVAALQALLKAGSLVKQTNQGIILRLCALSEVHFFLSDAHVGRVITTQRESAKDQKRLVAAKLIMGWWLGVKGKYLSPKRRNLLDR